MDETALFTLSYGLFILATEWDGKKNACIINTCGQVTQTPNRVSITVLKSNLTHDMICDSDAFSISVLGQQASLDTIARFGFKSGRDTNKLEGIDYKKDSLNNPVIEMDSIATMSCKVIQKVDLGTHTLFIADVIEAKRLEAYEPMTYAYYRDLKAGKVIRGENRPVQTSEGEGKETYHCTVCHYIYDGDVPFEALPEDYRCPVCNQPKKAFMQNN